MPMHCASLCYPFFAYFLILFLCCLLSFVVFLCISVGDSPLHEFHISLVILNGSYFIVVKENMNSPSALDTGCATCCHPIFCINILITFFILFIWLPGSPKIWKFWQNENNYWNNNLLYGMDKPLLSVPTTLSCPGSLSNLYGPTHVTPFNL